VNDGIPESEGHIRYEFFESAIQLVQSFGHGALLAKLDLKEAFHHIPVHSADWHLVFHWNLLFYYTVVLVFGLKLAPYTFNLFAEALHWIIQRHLPGKLYHYLDDFLPVIGPGTPLPLANTAVDWCQDLGNQLGLSFQDEKTVHPEKINSVFCMILFHSMCEDY
jgi:Reverse transcriptase (RNA-dependent DNA polymerase)